MTNSRVQKCLVELQKNPIDLHRILNKWECVITFDTEPIDAEYNRAVAIISDGVNQITASELVHVSYYPYMRKLYSLASLLCITFKDEKLKDLFQ